MLKINYQLTPSDLLPKIERLWSVSAGKLLAITRHWQDQNGSPVYTKDGKYTTRGWTEWTRGFMFGSALLQYDAVGDEKFLRLGLEATLTHMSSHITHMGVHDHGFNIISTYGNLLRMMNQGRIPENPWQRRFFELALQCSGAVQARRWSRTSDGGGYIYSFNGPHSLFADTIRSLRSLALAYRLGQVLMEENDQSISLLERLIQHAAATAKYNVYYGRGRDYYDIRGRVAHESIFNLNDGQYRCPCSQQGYSPFSTWTRALAWIILGFAEELEFISSLTDDELSPYGSREQIETFMLEAAAATGDFYIKYTPTDGIPYWDTAAPGLRFLGDYLDRPAEPLNDYEPVDSSAAVIAAQGLLRLGYYLKKRGDPRSGQYFQAGLTVLDRLFAEPYLSNNPHHQGLILHSVYHRPNGWDYIPPQRKIPCGESSMWGDYHAREAALYIQRLAEGDNYYTFFQ